MWTTHIGNAVIQVSCSLLLWALIGQILIRAINSGLRSFELVHPAKNGHARQKTNSNGTSWCCEFRKDYLSCHPSADVKDYFLPSILGFIELLIYPTLILTGKWAVIGGWLTLKTAAKWKGWKADRNSYNRFLIGNALVILVAIIILSFTDAIKIDPQTLGAI